MLVAAFVILAVAVLLGSVLAVPHLQTEGRAPPWSLAALHGSLPSAASAALLSRYAARHEDWIRALLPSDFGGEVTHPR
jgi:hypothetical protein